MVSVWSALVVVSVQSAAAVVCAERCNGGLCAENLAVMSAVKAVELMCET